MIGPNNSGKSNILSALKLFSDYIYFLENKRNALGADINKEVSFMLNKVGSYLPIIFTATFIDDNLKYYSLLMHFKMQEVTPQRVIFQQMFCISSINEKIQVSNMREIVEKFDFVEVNGFDTNYNAKLFNEKKISFEELLHMESNFKREHSVLFNTDVELYNKSGEDFTKSIHKFKNHLLKTFCPSSIYSIQVEKLKAPARLTANEESVLPDGSNLVSFIDSMRDTNPKIIREIEKDLFRFTKEFESIRLIKVTGDSTTDATFKKLGLADKDDNTFWSDQLSEGVLYFLALLAIIHQPNPPHLLMLEEPEKGIHPRRIKEIIELIFQIAKDKGIRVILTTHSTYVVDQFTEIPEGVHIVDKIDKSTQVKNLKRDFIDKEEGREDKIDYLSSLGEHWSIGFLGGVPE